MNQQPISEYVINFMNEFFKEHSYKIQSCAEGDLLIVSEGIKKAISDILVLEATKITNHREALEKADTLLAYFEDFTHDDEGKRVTE